MKNFGTSVKEKLVAKDLGNYFKIPADNRDLNYDKYFFKGMSKTKVTQEYNSENTDRLSEKQLIKLLASIGYR